MIFENDSIRFKDPLNPTPEEIKAFYEKAQREFTIDDLKMFFVEEEGQPFDELVAELEERVRRSKSERAEQ